METPAALPPDIWERTPPEAQAYIRALEARVETLTTMVHLTEAGRHVARTAEPDLAEFFPPPIERSAPDAAAAAPAEYNAVVVVNRAILALRAP